MLPEPEYEIIPFQIEEVEALFYTFCQGYHQGIYDLDVLKLGLETLVFFDKEGRLWTLGVNTGQWYYWERFLWLKGNPAGTLYQAEEVEKEEKESKPVLDLKNPIMKKLLKKT
jgi:hypothetical protein